jgi:alkylhydroperoxidase family enzyme
VVKELHPTSQGALNDKQWAALRYADAMTRDVKVEEGLFEEVKRGWSEREVVEITCTVASYNMVSRFLVALDVGEMNGKMPEGL